MNDMIRARVMHERQRNVHLIENNSIGFLSDWS